MSDLIAVAYPDRETAETVRRTLGQLALEHVIELDDAVVVSRNEKGKVGLHHYAQQPRRSGAKQPSPPRRARSEAAGACPRDGPGGKGRAAAERMPRSPGTFVVAAR
jgi:hypothetical protein